MFGSARDAKRGSLLILVSPLMENRCERQWQRSISFRYRTSNTYKPLDHSNFGDQATHYRARRRDFSDSSPTKRGRAWYVTKPRPTGLNPRVTALS